MEILKTFGQEKSFPHVKCLWDIWRRTSEQNHICVFVGVELFPDNQLVSVSLLFLCVCFLCMFLCERAPSASKNGCVEITLYKGLEGFRWPVTSCIVCRTLRLKMRHEWLFQCVTHPLKPIKSYKMKLSDGVNPQSSSSSHFAKVNRCWKTWVPGPRPCRSVMWWDETNNFCEALKQEAK